MIRLHWVAGPPRLKADFYWKYVLYSVGVSRNNNICMTTALNWLLLLKVNIGKPAVQAAHKQIIPNARAVSGTASQ